MPLRDRLTQIGTVTLPVYALSLRDAPNLSNFTFFRFADCTAEVTGDDDVRLGSIGGIIGAHYLCHINRDQGSSVEAELIIDVEEAWDAFLALFDSSEAQNIVRRLQKECTVKFEQRSAEVREADERQRRLQLEQELAGLEQEEKELTDATNT